MELNYKLWGVLLVLSLAQVSRAQLKCYVCKNCAEVNANTPLLDCDEDFFNSGGNTEPSTQTTTDMPTGTTEMPTESAPTSTSTATPSTTESSSSTSDSTTESTTSSFTTTSSSSSSSTEHITTTEGTTSDSTTTMTNNTSSSTSTTPMTSTTNDATSSNTTTEKSTLTTDSTTPMDSTTEESETTTNAQDNTESTNATEAKPPTPSTVRPPSSIPTPPNPGAETPIDDSVKYYVNGTESDRGNTKPYIASSQFRVRQARAVSDYTYHCFKVSANVNGSMITSRGCSRVKPIESVCGQWKEQHPMEQLNKCHPCSNTRCNGSTALNLSLGALALTLVAALLQSK